MNYSLDNIRNFINESQLRPRFQTIHITGTNGKTSVAIFLHQMLLGAGCRAGLFTSPHLKSEDMIKTDKAISKQQHDRIIKQYLPLIKKHQLSPFEIDVVVMIDYFNSNVDIAVIEVGMGGTHDATNVIDGMIAIITSIDLDHQEYLGNSLEEITRHKCGIIKRGSQVVCPRFPEQINRIIIDQCNRLNAGLHIVDKQDGKLQIDQEIIDFDGALYQKDNAALAIKAAQLIGLDSVAIKKGLNNFFNPCRYQKINNLILDGAHNPAGIIRLIAALKHDNINGSVVFAAFKDKDYVTMFKQIKEYFKEIYLCYFEHPRAASVDDIDPENKYLRISIEAIKELKGVVIVTGSLAFNQILLNNYL